ncbi:erg4 erg24 ergosterol biosynthesis-like protein [Moniliophthora roreri MCA 2997]|uniref:Erg4 erg24 ergosterol biosynthesis-like protein n=1 Tax=Moniliophthora roreri (strain MCA 2997) TaxID=1381753 RepID=V2W2B6_MONRO|nr:erg4 erg24 ergosterol biosynthesis-like protein [Moniliophthora roreri MCA 2997]
MASPSYAPKARSSKPPPHPLIKRESKNNTLLSRTVYFVSRALDIPLQYNILANGLAEPLIKSFGGETLLPYPYSATQQGGITSFLGLSPYRTILLSMAVTAVAKHNYWAVRISREEMHPVASAIVGIFNSTFNSINTILFTCASTSVIRTPADEWVLTSPTLLVGSALFFGGIALEWHAERQRKAFKDDVRNVGKPYRDGLFGLARHINYGGYTLWRTGFAIASGGWLWGAINALLFTASFGFVSIPELDWYCQEKYGNAWTNYKRRVPYKLLPGIY